MTLFLYNFLWQVLKNFVPTYLKYRVRKGKEEENRIHERYGVPIRKRDNGNLIWLHGSSVGESVAALALAKSMLKIGFNKKRTRFYPCQFLGYMVRTMYR